MTSPQEDSELAGLQASQANLPAVQRDDDDLRVIEFMGEKFRVAREIGIMPLLKYSDAAELRTSDPRALSAMYRLIKDTIYEGHPGCGECEDCTGGSELACEDYDAGDWPKFELRAMETKASAEDMLDFTGKVLELIIGRPTRPSGGSSPGRRSGSAGSTRRSSGRAGKGSRR